MDRKKKNESANDIYSQKYLNNIFHKLHNQSKLIINLVQSVSYNYLYTKFGKSSKCYQPFEDFFFQYETNNDKQMMKNKTKCKHGKVRTRSTEDFVCNKMKTLSQ